MESLFEDLYTSERDKVHFAVHCLQRCGGKGLGEIDHLTFLRSLGMGFGDWRSPPTSPTVKKENFRKDSGN